MTTDNLWLILKVTITWVIAGTTGLLLVTFVIDRSLTVFGKQSPLLDVLRREFVDLLVMYFISALAALPFGIPMVQAGIFRTDVILVPVAGMAFASIIRMLVVSYRGATTFSFVIWLAFSTAMVIFTALYSPETLQSVVGRTINSITRESQQVTAMLTVGTLMFVVGTEVVNKWLDIIKQAAREGSATGG